VGDRIREPSRSRQLVKPTELCPPTPASDPHLVVEIRTIPLADGGEQSHQ
jgi:hypothetical protein